MYADSVREVNTDALQLRRRIYQMTPEPTVCIPPSRIYSGRTLSARRALSLSSPLSTLLHIHEHDT